MKKLFSSLLIAIFCLNVFSFNNIYANYDKTYYTKNIIIYKSELNKSIKGGQYIKKIDGLINDLKNNEKILINLNNNLEKILNENSIKNNDILNTLNYLYANVNVALINIENNKNNEITTSNISEIDKNFAQEKILLFQKNMIDNSKGIIGYLIKNIEGNNYKEVGDLNINLELNQESLGNIDANLSLNNYEATKHNYDSQFKGNVKTTVVGNYNDENINFELSTMVDFISKQGNIFLLLKDLNIIGDEKLYYVNQYTEKFKQMASKNQYIKYEDPSTKAGLNIINSINFNNIISDLSDTLSKPMFEAYKKVGNKYYIKPTKYGCDSLKKLANKFDPFNGSTCTDGQYDDLLKSFIKNGNLYLIFENNLNTIGFEGNINNFEKNSGFVTFSDTKIEEIKYELKDYYTDLSIEYKYSKNLNINLDSYETSFIFDSTLDFNNNFSFIEMDLLFSEYLKSNIKLENNKISGITNIYEGEKEIIKITTSGNYSKNKLELNNKIELSSEASSNFNYENQIQKSRDSSRITDLYSLMAGIEQSYQDFGEYPTKDNFRERTELYFWTSPVDPSGNIEIDGCKFGYYYEVGIDDNGIPNQVYKLSTCLENQLNIENRAKNDGGIDDKKYEVGILGENYSEGFFINDEKDWKKVERKNIEYNISGALNIILDKTDNKNNFYILFNLLNNNSKLFNLEIDNKSTKSINNNEIKEPTNYIDFKEVFDMYDYYY